ncbi:MAG: phosphate signaling complex protein PhoU [bacterium]
MTVHMQREIEKLKRKVLTFGAQVEVSIQKAARSLKDRDPEIATQVIDDDFEMDQLEVEIEEDCLKILALYNPVATDLRFVVAVLKINNDLERIADQSVNIAQRAMFLTSNETVEIPYELSLMVEKTQAMLRWSLEALINLDVSQARQIILDDDEVDILHRRMYEIIATRIRKNPDCLECLINILISARHLERIADQVTNIAEDVIYLVSGEIVRHDRKRIEKL